MKIAIIGAGFTGLTLAYNLSLKGHTLTIVEAEDKAGGLASGFTRKKWDWSLEKHYHHLFTNDSAIINLAREVGQKILKLQAKTSTLYNNRIYQIDSPISLLRFNELSFVSRIRTGIVLFFLKISPLLKIYENITAEKFLIKTMGDDSWKVLWRPLFVKKFNKDYKKIALVWFWARIKKRTKLLCYPKEGFQGFVGKIVSLLKKKGVKFYLKESYRGYLKKGKKLIIKTNKRSFLAEKIINTLPSKDSKIKMIGALNIVLVLKKPFFLDDTYWLNVNDEDYPFLSVVEHTNFINKKYYNNRHVIYIGNYLKVNDYLYNKNIDQIIDIYLPYLKKINSKFKKNMIAQKFLFRDAMAQPIVTKNYSKKIPPFISKIDGVYNANIQQVYPWDRGTNYAVEIGIKVSNFL